MSLSCFPPRYATHTHTHTHNCKNHAFIHKGMKERQSILSFLHTHTHTHTCMTSHANPSSSCMARPSYVKMLLHAHDTTAVQSPHVLNILSRNKYVQYTRTLRLIILRFLYGAMQLSTLEVNVCGGYFIPRRCEETFLSTPNTSNNRQIVFYFEQNLCIVVEAAINVWTFCCMLNITM